MHSVSRGNLSALIQNEGFFFLRHIKREVTKRTQFSIRELGEDTLTPV